MKQKVIAEIVATSWTVLGLFVAWVVLEGTSKAVVGALLLAVVLGWAVTMPFRLRD